MEWHLEAIERLKQYATDRKRHLSYRLGQRYDGVVFSTTCGTAFKSLAFERLYQRERDVYIRLRANNIESVVGFAVPSMIDHDDRLWMI